MIGDFKAVEVISLFVEDLQSARRFYTEVLDLTVTYEDDVSCVVKFGNLMLNLLHVSEAPQLVTPRLPGMAGDGPRFLMTVATADADGMFAELSSRGVTFLNGPIDRPWGRRTAAFADPAGVVWEIAQELPPPAE